LNTLVIDAASSLEIVAVCSARACVNESSFVDSSHSALLLESVERCLKKAGLGIRDIGLIGVGLGPGSFTGIRIAVSTGRMLSQVLGAPLVGIKTHILYAASIDAVTGDNILIAFDAKKQRVFGALYHKSEQGAPREIVPPGDYPIRKLIESIDTSHASHMAGSGIEKYLTEIRGAVENMTVLYDFIPDGGSMCGLVAGAFREDPARHEDYNVVVPFYARKSDAEEAGGRRRG
jgi:tRNA threonylcarbamoyladenosine biosynthesis protein TsaB